MSSSSSTERCYCTRHHQRCPGQRLEDHPVLIETKQIASENHEGTWEDFKSEIKEPAGHHVDQKTIIRVIECLPRAANREDPDYIFTDLHFDFWENSNYDGTSPSYISWYVGDQLHRLKCRKGELEKAYLKSLKSGIYSGAYPSFPLTAGSPEESYYPPVPLQESIVPGTYFAAHLGSGSAGEPPEYNPGVSLDPLPHRPQSAMGTSSEGNQSTGSAFPIAGQQSVWAWSPLVPTKTEFPTMVSPASLPPSSARGTNYGGDSSAGSASAPAEYRIGRPISAVPLGAGLHSAGPSPPVPRPQTALGTRRGGFPSTGSAFPTPGQQPTRGWAAQGPSGTLVSNYGPLPQPWAQDCIGYPADQSSQSSASANASEADTRTPSTALIHSNPLGGYTAPAHDFSTMRRVLPLPALTEGPENKNKGEASTGAMVLWRGDTTVQDVGRTGNVPGASSQNTWKPKTEYERCYKQADWIAKCRKNKWQVKSRADVVVDLESHQIPVPLSVDQVAVSLGKNRSGVKFHWWEKHPDPKRSRLGTSAVPANRFAERLQAYFPT